MTWKLMDEVSLARISNAIKELKALKEKEATKNANIIQDAIEYSRDAEEDDADFLMTTLAEKLSDDELMDEDERILCKKWMNIFEVMK
jgi:hypothetical protein